MKHTTVAVYIHVHMARRMCFWPFSSRSLRLLCNRTLFLNFNFIQDCLGGKRVGGDIRRIFLKKRNTYDGVI